MPTYTVAVLGGVVQDLTTVVKRLPDDGETVAASNFIINPGGKGSISAVSCYRLTRSNPKNVVNDNGPALSPADDDIRVRMVGAVGVDDFGAPLKDNLMKCGVNVDGVRTLEGQKTAVANILVEASTGANRMIQFPGAADALEPSEFMTAESLGGGVPPDLLIAQLEVQRETIEQAIETANEEGIEVLLNPSPAAYVMHDIYPMVTHLVMNETEAVMLSPIEPDEIGNEAGWTCVADYFLGLGVKNVVVTLGEKGAYYATESTRGRVNAEERCTVCDTSGAGYTAFLRPNHGHAYRIYMYTDETLQG